MTSPPFRADVGPDGVVGVFSFLSQSVAGTQALRGHHLDVKPKWRWGSVPVLVETRGRAPDGDGLKGA